MTVQGVPGALTGRRGKPMNAAVTHFFIGQHAPCSASVAAQQTIADAEPTSAKIH